MDEFWRQKRLDQMTAGEWESLCDGCGRCCLVKLRDEDDDDVVYYTDVACTLFDLGSCRCSDYDNRQSRVSDCVALTPAALATITWLPPSCAYRRLAEGRDLAWWHPLLSGTFQTVRKAGISVHGRAVMETDIRDEELENHVVVWPLRQDEDGQGDGP